MNDSLDQWDEIQPPDFEIKTDTYRLALESIFRWTVRRDELSDAEIVRAIKKVAVSALENS